MTLKRTPSSSIEAEQSGQAQQAQPTPPRHIRLSSDNRTRLIRALRSTQLAPSPGTAPTAAQSAPAAASGTTSMAASTSNSRPAAAAATTSVGSAGSAAATTSPSSAGSTTPAASSASPMPLITPTFTPSTPTVTPSTATASATNSPRFTSTSVNSAASITTAVSSASSNTAANSTPTATPGAPAPAPAFGTIAPSTATPFRFFGQGTATTSTAASTPTAGSFSFGQQSFVSTTASTPTAGSFFARAAATATTSASASTVASPFGLPPSALTAANTSATGGLFGQSTATVTPSTATAWTTTTTPSSTGLFGSTESLFKLTSALQNVGRMSVSLEMTWSAAMVANAEKSFTAPFYIKAEKYDDICLSCTVKAVEDTFLFQIRFPTLEDMERFDWVKSASVLGMHRRSPTPTAVTRWADSLMMSISGPIEAKQLPATHDSSLFAASIGLYSSEATKFTTPLFAASPSSLFGAKKPTTYCEAILGRMLDDHSSHDVFFEFENPLADLEQVVDEIRTGDLGEKMDGGEKISDPEAQEKSLEKKPVEEPAETADDSTATASQPKPATTMVDDHHSLNTTHRNNVYHNHISSSSSIIHADQIPTRQKQTIGAHKIVLSQVEYFQTMFSSSFAEGGPGVKKILIKDVDLHCFRVLIEFIYLGELRPASVPKFLTEDQAQGQTPTWEDLYLLADRYNIAALREMAGSRILWGLHATWAVPFLFRTAYLFEELRPRVIKFVVKNCVLMIVQKKVQQDYFDHPECSAIFGEIITELSSVRAS